MDESKFKVEVKTQDYIPKQYLAVTHNGHQWGTIDIINPRHEIPLIIEVLADYLYEYTLHVSREEEAMKYRRLTQRDIIQEEDEYFTNWGTWTVIEPEYIGKRKGSVLGWYIKMRRKE